MDEIGHCLICGASDEDAPGPFCCEGCHAPHALTVVCVQCRSRHRHTDKAAIGIMSETLSVAVLERGHVAMLPYCGACVDIKPQRPIGEVVVYAITQK